MFLSSLLPAYGRHYFKCHSELNFYTTNPIKINLTWGYLFHIFLVFQSQRAPWVEAHTCHPSPHHWERWLKQGNSELEVILGYTARPFLKHTKPQSAQSPDSCFAALPQDLLVYQVSALSWACYGQPGLSTDCELSSPAPPMRRRSFVLLLFSLIINTDVHMYIFL